MAAITRLVKRTTTTPFYSLARGFSSTISHAPPRLNRNIQWVFLGCPGVGKGTYASRLCNLLGVPHIATGDLVRHELSSNGPLSSQVSSFSIFCCMIWFCWLNLIFGCCCCFSDLMCCAV
jgi:adenylate kinase